MGWPVYSHTFLQHNTPNAWSTYTVPTDSRAVVRGLLVAQIGNEAGSMQVHAGREVISQLVIPETATTVTVQCAVAVYAGQPIGVFTTAAGIVVTVYGYLFTDPTGETGPPPGAATKPGLPVPEFPE